MKKIKKVIAIILFVTIASCDIADTPIKLSVSNSITRDVNISIAQTSVGTTKDIDLRETINLADIVSNVADITAVKVNSISYKYKDFSGNQNGRIETVLLKIDTVVLANETDVNVFSEVENATSHLVTDASALTKLEDILLTNKETVMAIIASVQSDDGAMEFKMEVTVDLTVTLKN